MTFSQMGLIDPLLTALNEEGYNQPTPIQAQAIPHLLQGRDLLGCAQTGTGKTAAFSLPILQRLAAQPAALGKRPIRTLILTPTRELAIQIEESLRAYGRHLPLRHLVIFGGVSQQPQVNGLQRGIDILVATPGRLLDLIQQGYVSLQHLDVFVLDEADRMLDMGFVHDVKRIITKLPAKRQTLFFSATMPPDIQQLANSILSNPVKVEVTPASTTAETVSQQLYHVSKNDKRHLLVHLLQQHKEHTSVLVFTRTKHGADRVVKDLMKAGETAQAIHGNKSQNARQLALQNFKKGVTRVLVATDIAARGIDIDDLGLVINYELPNIPETYVHRIGRTGRAGAAGMAFSFCEGEERAYLKDIQKLIGKTIPVMTDHPFAQGNGTASHVMQEKALVHHLKEASRHQGSNRQQQRKPQHSATNRAATNKPDQQPQNKRPQSNGNAPRREQQQQDVKRFGKKPIQVAVPGEKRKEVMPERKPLQQAVNNQPPATTPVKKPAPPHQQQPAAPSKVPVAAPLFSDDDRW